MDLTRDRGRRAWLEEVEMLERRRTRRPWQAIRPGVRSSKLDVFIILLPLLPCRMALDMKERAEVIAKQEEAMRVSLQSP